MEEISPEVVYFMALSSFESFECGIPEAPVEIPLAPPRWFFPVPPVDGVFRCQTVSSLFAGHRADGRNLKEAVRLMRGAYGSRLIALRRTCGAMRERLLDRWAAYRVSHTKIA